MHFLNYTVILTKGFEGRTPCTKSRSIGLAHSKREIPNLAGMCLTEDLTEGILSGAWKLTGLITLLNYAVT